MSLIAFDNLFCETNIMLTILNSFKLRSDGILFHGLCDNIKLF